MTSTIALLNLLQNLLRTLIGVAGVGFAVALMFTQLAFLEAGRASASSVLRRLDFDVALLAVDYHHFFDARTVPRVRLAQAKAVPGVARVRPLQISVTKAIKLPGDDAAAAEQLTLGNLFDIGVISADHAAFLSEIRPLEGVYSTETAAFVNANSDKVSLDPFEDQDTRLRVAGHEVTIAGEIELGGQLGIKGPMLVSEAGFFRIFPFRSADEVSIGLVDTDRPEDARRVADELARRFPRAIITKTKQQLIHEEQSFWLKATPFGNIFTLGYWTAMVVGTVIVYQVLSSEISSHLGEYATLKAMGYPNSFMVRIVLIQAVVLAIAAYLSGSLLGWFVYQRVAAALQVEISMISFDLMFYRWDLWQPLAAALGMCVGSAILALAKIFRADPAELF